MAELLNAFQVSCARSLREGAESVVRDVTFAIEEGAFTAVCGPAGCGRNLLLRVLGMLETPDAGELFFRHMPTVALDAESRLRLRQKHFGFVFAEPFLLPNCSVLENVAIPLLKNSGLTLGEARTQIMDALSLADLAGCAEAPAGSLPLVAQHKVALARALASRPVVLLVEESSTALSDGDGAEFLALLGQAQGRTGLAIIVSRATPPGSGRLLEMGEGGIIHDSAAQPGALA